MANTPLPPLEFLRECFDYDPETGALRWKRRPSRHFTNIGSARRWNSRLAGRVAFGNQRRTGYFCGQVSHAGKTVDLYAHRVAFKLMTGRDPADQIDHRNGDKADNRWLNLREATASDNMRNRGRKRDLPKGVFFLRGRFEARSCDGTGRNAYLGRYDTPKEAHAAYIAFGREVHGEFFNPGAPVESIFD